MTAPLKEQIKSLATTTLNGSINNSVTSITVTDGSVFPSTGNFRLVCQSEIMLCTARSSNTLTVTRGHEGTTAASHADALAISLVLTAGSLKRRGMDYHPIFGASIAERPFGKIMNDGATAALAVSDFTWDHQGSASATDQNGTILMRYPVESGTNAHVLYRSAPSTPYAYIAAWRCCMPSIQSGSANRFGLCFRKNSDGKLNAINCIPANDSSYMNLEVSIWNTSTSFFTTEKSSNRWFTLDVVWLKIENDGTNLKFYTGIDGKNWILIKSFGKTTYMSGGPDQVGFFVSANSNNTHEGIGRLLHWSKE